MPVTRRLQPAIEAGQAAPPPDARPPHHATLTSAPPSRHRPPRLPPPLPPRRPVPLRLVLLICVVAAPLSLLAHHRHRRAAPPHRPLPPPGGRAASAPPAPPLLASATSAPDDEGALAAGRVQMEGGWPVGLDEQMLACMPTVRRPGGVEYVSNAVKSWRLATNGSSSLHRLAVFDMDAAQLPPMRDAASDAPSPPAWLRNVFTPPLQRHQQKGMRQDVPGWLVLRGRTSTPKPPRKLTLGDNEARVAWRSKETQDYAEVLRECAALATGRYVLIVQDDVLFTSRIAASVAWADANFAERPVVDKVTGRPRRERVCSLSLFDVAPDGKGGEEEEMGDGHALRSSNMVARVWRVEDVDRVARVIDHNFDEAPVDWLTDKMCSARRRVTKVMEPNAVRHRGSVSSFAENKRDGLLT